MAKKPLFLALFFFLAPLPLLSQTAENPQKPSYYIVKKGDCLWNISKKVWGDPTKWPLLYATNEGKIHNPNLIYPGQKFKIPTTITKEQLRKAYELAQARVIGMEGKTVKVHKKQETTSPSTGSSNTAPSAGEKPENAVNLPAAQGNQPAVNTTNPTPGTTTPEDGSSNIVVALVFLVALGGGLFLWFRKRSGGAVQEPRPLSSFPQASEPPVSKPTVSSPTPQPTPVREERMSPPPSVSPTTTPRPISTPASSTPTTPTTPTSGQTGAIPPVTTPQNPPAAAAAPPAQPGQETLPGIKTSGFTGANTSISVSQPPQPSKAEPPSTPSSSTLPSTPAPSTPPAQKPPENKPPDTPSDSAPSSNP